MSSSYRDWVLAPGEALVVETARRQHDAEARELDADRDLGALVAEVRAIGFRG